MGFGCFLPQTKIRVSNYLTCLGPTGPTFKSRLRCRRPGQLTQLENQKVYGEMSRENPRTKG